MDAAYSLEDINKIMGVNVTPYKTPSAPIPEYIKLPDGRRVETRSLYAQVSKTHNIRLRGPGVTEPRRTFTDAEKIDIARSEISAIMKKYGMTQREAENTRGRMIYRIRQANLMRAKHGLQQIDI